MANRDITESGVQEVLRTMGIPTSFKGFREDVTGRAEALATVGSGMAGTMAGMGGGMIEMLRSGNPQAALDQYRQIQEAMTFVPRTQKGLENVQDIGEFFEPVANIYERFGEGVTEQTGSPVVGEFAQEFVDPLDLMGLGAVSAIPAIARKSRFAENVASQKTQRANTVATAIKASNYLDELGAKGKFLDYGAGFGENAKAIKADETFEPFPQGEFNPTYTDPAQVPENAYGRIISTNVLNVLPPDIREEAVLTIGKALEPDGIALVQAWDVGAAKQGLKSKQAIPVESEPNAYTTSTGSYQKGFSRQELQEYIAETLGPGFLVEPVPNKADISGTSVTIKKIADPSIELDLDVPEADINAIAEQSIRAFHGSPYDFEKFDWSEIGTGQGAQMYGHGLYFAEVEDVAETYKQAPEVLDGFDNFAMSKEADAYLYDLGESLIKSDPLLSDAIAELRYGDFPPDVIKRKMRDFDDDYTPEEIEAAIGRFDDVLKDIDEKFSGKMYEVRIKAKPEELLDWDKPLSEQPSVMKKLQDFVDKKVQEKNGNIFLTNEYIQSLNEMLKYPEEIRGWEVYSDFQDRAKGLPLEGKESKGQKASAILEEAGLKGIRYDDELSRGKEGGTSNFVVFDPRIIDIAKKYGVAIPVAGYILSQAEGQQQQQQPQA